MVLTIVSIRSDELFFHIRGAKLPLIVVAQHFLHYKGIKGIFNELLKL